MLTQFTIEVMARISCVVNSLAVMIFPLSILYGAGGSGIARKVVLPKTHGRLINKLRTFRNKPVGGA